MKLLFLLSTQNFGGAQRSTLELAKLVSQQHEVLIIDTNGHIKSYEEKIKEYGLTYKCLRRENEREFRFSRSFNPFSLIYSICSFAMSWIRIRRRFSNVITRFKPDFIFLIDTKSLSIVPRNKSIGKIFVARGWYTKNQVSIFKRFIIKCYSINFIAISEATRHAIYTSGLATLDQIFVLPNSIDRKNIHNVKPDSRFNNEPFIIFHAGGFIRTKGQHISIAIAKKLKQANVDFKMVIAGFVYNTQASVKYLEELRSDIADSGLEKNVHLEVNCQDVHPIHKASHVLIHPSETEGMPKVVMEAMAFGKPVIANPVGGVIDLITHGYNGFITNHNNANDYVKYLLLLKNDPDYYLQVSLKGIELIDKVYSSDIQINRLNFILNQLNEKTGNDN